MLSMQFGWRRSVLRLALVCLVGSALAVGASGSALAKAPDPSCRDGAVCLFADAKWEGKQRVYSCDPGERGTRTWRIAEAFPPALAGTGEGKGVSSYVSNVDRAALFDGTKLETMKRGPRHLLGSDNDAMTDLTIDCGVARNETCGEAAPGGFGFSCNLTRRGRSRGVSVTFDGAKRGHVTLTRTRGATKATLCDAAPNDGHAGPMIRVVTPRVQQYTGTERGCRTHHIPSQVRKFKVWWSARSTDWVHW